MRVGRRARRAAARSAPVLLAFAVGCAPLAVLSRSVTLSPDGATRVGPLEYRGGVTLASGDRRFGGLSAIVVSRDGRLLTAVTDEGNWITARLAYDGRGWLASVDRTQVGPLRDVTGRALQGKVEQDAEALTELPDGSFVVAFERRHRLLRYPVTHQPLRGVPTPLDPPPGLAGAPPNEGVEALTTLSNGRLFALTENLAVEGGVRGWTGGASGWKPFAFRVSGLPRPSGSACLPSGDVVVLVRGYSPATGVVVRLELLRTADLEHGGTVAGYLLAVLKAPLTVDNFEGIAAREGTDGEVLLYLVSDDNFSRSQRTLLMMFALRLPPGDAE